MIKPSCDRKTRFYKTQKNTFGLLPGSPDNGGTCIGATTGVGGCMAKEEGHKQFTCYVHGVMQIYKNVRAVLEHNTNLLHNANLERKIELLKAEFERFKSVELKHAKRNSCPAHLTYRLHWAGDIFSLEYAQALAEAMKAFPEIRFWNYSRSFHLLQPLCACANLTQFLSLDPCNRNLGLSWYDDLRSHASTKAIVRYCYMGDAIPDSMPQLFVCPTDSGKIKSEGACPSCQNCIGTRNEKGAAPISKCVWFKT